MGRVNGKVSSLLRPELLAMDPYRIPDPGDYVKLDAMENPYSWPSPMVDEWLAKLRSCQPNRYPPPSPSALRAVIKQCNAVPSASEILLGNGSDELIQMILMGIAGSKSVVLAPEPTFVMYRHIAYTLGLRYEAVPLDQKTFELDRNAMRKAIRLHQPAVIFLAYPNNPTGNLFALEDILDILELAPGLVVIDEAYAPFADSSFIHTLADFDQLLVMRTLSKLGLAGLRLGFLAGSPAWLEQLDKLRLPYNINVLTQISAEFALSRYAVFEQQAQQICQNRELLFAALQSMDGVHPFPSRANFILLRLEQADATAVFSALKIRGILVKNMHGPGTALPNCLRVTVGTTEENGLFIHTLTQILAG